jgi:hypothetical protein
MTWEQVPIETPEGSRGTVVLVVAGSDKRLASGYIYVPGSDIPAERVFWAESGGEGFQILPEPPFIPPYWEVLPTADGFWA